MHTDPDAMFARVALSCGAVIILSACAALAQEDAGSRQQADDQAEVALRFDRAGWPQDGAVLAGLRLPESGLPGLDVAAEMDDSLSFDSVGGVLVSVRERRALAEGGMVSLTLVVAPTQQVAQDALLATIGQTSSRPGNPWVRDAGAGTNEAWGHTGDVRFGIVAQDGVVPVVAFARASVLVLVRAQGTLASSALDVAVATGALLEQTPARAADGAAVTALELAPDAVQPLAFRSITPLVVTSTGFVEVELSVTAGGIEPAADGGHAYYAGESGTQTITARAIDAHGFPTSAALTVEVAPDAGR